MTTTTTDIVMRPWPGPHTTVDITPTWTGVMPSLINVLQNPDASNKSLLIAREELMRLAAAVDVINATGKTPTNATWDTDLREGGVA